MKELKYNRKAASIVLVIVIILSIILGCNRSIGSLENDVKDIYKTGSQAYGKPIQDVAVYTNNGQELYAIAEAYGYGTDEFKDGLALLKTKGGSVTQVQEPLETVKAQAETAYAAILTASEIPEYDRDAAIMYMTQMETAMYKLSQNVVYAEAAEKYNEAIKGILPRLIMHSAKPAVVF